MINTKKDEQNKDKWYHKLRDKYRLVIMNDTTFEERLSFRLTRLNVFIALGTLSIVLIVLTTLLIAFTPLKEYIPGYTDVGLQQNVYRLSTKADSLEAAFRQQDLYMRTVRSILEGKPINDSIPQMQDSSINYDTLALDASAEDSALRAQYENQNRFDLYFNEDGELYADKGGNITCFTPLKGIVTTNFSLAENHYGVDIVAKKNETIKATLDGTVIFADWTVETGHVIAIQHTRNIISVYKHNSALLKKAGNYVKAGDPIAIIGESGELTTGPHLHFELWHNGTPVNPLNYMTF
ncbi:MAG: peptidase M23 [Bacteroidetes bacterium]|nr:peptidase M23 [Bacteroidota bacterium]